MICKARGNTGFIFLVYITRIFYKSYNRKNIMEPFRNERRINMKCFEIIYNGVINYVWAKTEMEARKQLREQINNG